MFRGGRPVGYDLDLDLKFAGEERRAPLKREMLFLRPPCKEQVAEPYWIWF